MQLNIQTLFARMRKRILDVQLSIEWCVCFMHDVSLLSTYVSCTGKGGCVEFRQMVCRMQESGKGLPWRTLNRNYCSDNSLVVVKPHKSYRWTPSFQSNTLLYASFSRSYNPQHHNLNTHLSQNFKTSYLTSISVFLITLQHKFCLSQAPTGGSKFTVGLSAKLTRSETDV